MLFMDNLKADAPVIWTSIKLVVHQEDGIWTVRDADKNTAASRSADRPPADSDRGDSRKAEDHVVLFSGSAHGSVLSILPTRTCAGTGDTPIIFSTVGLARSGVVWKWCGCRPNRKARSPRGEDEDDHDAAAMLVRSRTTDACRPHGESCTPDGSSA